MRQVWLKNEDFEMRETLLLITLVISTHTHTHCVSVPPQALLSMLGGNKRVRECSPDSWSVTGSEDDP